MTLTFGSLFAGIGGFDLGLERAGMVCKWQVEKDDYRRRVLAKHWPDVPRFEMVQDVGKHNLEPVDLICGGFPCQPHSVAGKRKGAADDRDLWPEYRRIIAELRPDWVLGENVPGIRTTILDSVLSDLEDLAYTTATFIVPACAFDAPHRRERVWIIANAKSNLRQTPRNDRSLALDGGDSLLADAKNARLDWRKRLEGDDSIKSHRGGIVRGGSGSDNASQVVANAMPQRCNRRPSLQKATGAPGRIPFERDYTWPTEPDVGRVAYGVPSRVDRLAALGDAVVPQVAEWLGRLIKETIT